LALRRRGFHVHAKNREAFLGATRRNWASQTRHVRVADCSLTVRWFLEGNPVRLTGQEYTAVHFQPAHSVLVDTQTEQEYLPLASPPRTYQSVMQVHILRFPKPLPGMKRFSRDDHYPEALVLLWRSSIRGFRQAAAHSSSINSQRQRRQMGAPQWLGCCLAPPARGQGPKHVQRAGASDVFMQLLR